MRASDAKCKILSFQLVFFPNSTEPILRTPEIIPHPSLPGLMVELNSLGRVDAQGRRFVVRGQQSPCQPLEGVQPLDAQTSFSLSLPAGAI